MKVQSYALAWGLMLAACSPPQSLRTSQFTAQQEASPAQRTLESAAEALLDAEHELWDFSQASGLSEARMTRLLLQFEGELSGEFIHELLVPGAPSPALDQSRLGMRMPLSPQVAQAELHLNLKLPLSFSSSRDALISVRQSQGADPEAGLQWSTADLKSPDLLRLHERLQPRKTAAGRELHSGFIEEWGAKVALWRARSGSAYQIRTLIWSPRAELLLTWEAEPKSERTRTLELALDAVLESGRALASTRDEQEIRSRLTQAQERLRALEALSADLPRLQEYCAKIRKQYDRLQAAL